MKCINPVHLILCTIFITLVASADTSNSRQDATTPNTNTISTLRWASTGGGWRSQFACVGLANLFSQPKLDILTKFGAISTTSGASWFSTQLFYSQQFHDQVTTEDSKELYEFVVQWMDAYKQMLIDAIESEDMINPDSFCNVTDLQLDIDLSGDRIEDREFDRDVVKVLSDLCHALVYFDGDWAECK